MATEEEISKELAKGFNDEPFDETIVNTGVKSTEDEPGDKDDNDGQQNVYKPVYADAWKRLETDGIEIPADIKNKSFKDSSEEWNAIQQLIIDNVEVEDDTQGGGSGVDDDEFISAYRSIAPEKRGEFLNSLYSTNRFLSLPTKDGVSTYYASLRNDKGEAKYSDETITKYVDGKSEIELDSEWEKIQDHTLSQQQKYFQQFSKGTADPQAIETANKNIDAKADIVLKEIMENDKYEEFPLTKEDKEDFAAKFKLISRIDPATRRPYFMSILNDDKVLRDMLLSYEIVHGKLGVHLSDFKKDFSDKLLGKLNLSKRPKSGGTAFVSAVNPQDFV